MVCSLPADAEIDPDLMEWNYGDYEGIRTDLNAISRLSTGGAWPDQRRFALF